MYDLETNPNKEYIFYLLAGLAFLGPPSSPGRSGSLALPFAGATRAAGRTPMRGLARLRLRVFRPVSRPVCGSGVFGLASLCVASPCYVACLCDCT
jgi:hypothetical protein